MIILVTGVPGSGKTAHAIDLLLDMVGTRPLFCDGVPELVIPHEPCPPVPEWTTEADDVSSATGKKISFTFPPNSIVIIDECQRVFRPRTSGAKVPPEVAAFETHRHLGIDFILITQHPSLLDGNIRRLVGKHVHIRVTALGRYKYEWAEVGDPDSRASREIAQKTRYALPKRAFSQYKSAEVHTKHKFAIPKAIFVLIGAAALLGFMTWRVYSSLSEKTGGSKALDRAQSGAIVPASSSSDGKPKKITVKEYVESYEPRVPGILHSAPVYDEITKPTVAPIITGCVVRSKTDDCKCYDQQGTVYKTTREVCRIFMTDGMFINFQKVEQATIRQEQLRQPVVEPQPWVGTLPDHPRGHVAAFSSPSQVPAAVPVQETNTSTNPRWNPAVRN